MAKVSAVLLCVLVSGCSTVVGSGNAVESKREVEAFSVVSVSGALDVAVLVGKGRSVVVLGDDNVVPLVETTVERGTLSLGTHGSYKTATPLRVSVVTPTLRALKISGAVSLSVAGVETARFPIRASGASSLAMKGRVKELDVSASGSSRLKLSGVEAETVHVIASGASSVDVADVQALAAELSGSASLTYDGDPTIRQTVSRSASLRKR